MRFFIFFKNNIPMINFVISFTALNFQFFILYPWFEELSIELGDIKKLIQK